MKDWRYRLAEHRGTLMAVLIFAVMFLIYVSNHPAGLTANVVQTASNKATLLAFVAVRSEEAGSSSMVTSPHSRSNGIAWRTWAESLTTNWTVPRRPRLCAISSGDAAPSS